MWPSRASWTPIETKLHPPMRRTGLVERSRLKERLESSLGQRLLLLSAPAGYGKTSSLVQAYQWLRGEGRRVGWISLDKDDNSLTCFAGYVLEALRRAELRCGEVQARKIGGGAGVPVEALKAALLNDLRALDEDFYFFLDDFHLITDPLITDLMTAMMLADLPKLHLFIATRGPNELPITRLRMQGQVAEFDIRDLAFSLDEVESLLRSVGGPLLTLTRPQMDVLRAKTEGWAASLQMAMIALQEQADVAQFVSRFSGTDRSIADFLVEEVLARQPEDIQHFLLTTSILKRFNCALCNAVLEERNSRELIDRLESLNLFIFSLDRDRNWYRYHHLFSELLHKRLADRHPDLIGNYHRRACDWLAANHLQIEAIDHAFAVDDYVRAGELLDAVTTEFFSTGQHVALRALADRLPAEVLRAQPRLQLELAWEGTERWRFEEAEAALDSIRKVLVQYSDGLDARLSERDVYELRTQLQHREAMLKVFRDATAPSIEAIHAWLTERRSGDAIMVESMKTAMLMCQRLRFEADFSKAKWASMRGRLQEAGAVYATVFVDAVAGETFRMRGELAAAEYVLLKGRETAMQMHGEYSELNAMPSNLLAQIYYEYNQIDRAVDLLSRLEDRSPEFGVLDHVISRFATSIRLARAAGDRRRAESLLEAGDSIAERFGFRRLQAHLLGERVHMLTADGQILQAAELLKDRRYRHWFDATAPLRHADTTEACIAVAHARTVVEAKDIAEAMSALKRWLHLLRDRHCWGLAIQFALVLAQLSVRAGDQAAARRHVLEALTWGEAGGFVRSFVDEGAVIAEQVSAVAQLATESRSVSDTYLAKLLDAFGPLGEQVGEKRPPAHQQTVEIGQAPSSREVEIMKLSAESMATKEIARTLGLTEGTVKWYWKRIFAKFGVNRRMMAIRVARQRGLIS